MRRGKTYSVIMAFCGTTTTALKLGLISTGWSLCCSHCHWTIITWSRPGAGKSFISGATQFMAGQGQIVSVWTNINEMQKPLPKSHMTFSFSGAVLLVTLFCQCIKVWRICYSLYQSLTGWIREGHAWAMGLSLSMPENKSDLVSGHLYLLCEMSLWLLLWL